MENLTWKTITIHAYTVPAQIEYCCQGCDEHCRRTVPINDDPPKECPKK